MNSKAFENYLRSLELQIMAMGHPPLEKEDIRAFAAEDGIELPEDYFEPAADREEDPGDKRWAGDNHDVYASFGGDL